MSADVGSLETQPLTTRPTAAGRLAGAQGGAPLGRTITVWLVAPAVLSAIWMTLSGDHFARPEIRAAFLAYLIAAPVLIGLYWWIRRPSQRLGKLLIVFGFAAWPLSLQASSDPLVFTIGVASESALAYLTFYLCLAFPRGRLTTTLDRRLMAGWALTLAVSWAPWLFAVPRLQGGGPLSTCVVECPANAFQIETIPQSTLLFIAPVGIALTVVFAAIIMGVQLSRLALSSLPQRRAQWPVTISTLLFLTAFCAFHLSRGLVPVEATATAAIEAVYICASDHFPARLPGLACAGGPVRGQGLAPLDRRSGGSCVAKLPARVTFGGTGGSRIAPGRLGCAARQST